MPKAPKSKARVYAPYVPLHNQKVMSQLQNKEDTLLLTTIVEQLGGCVVPRVRCDVKTVVTEDEDGPLSASAEKFVGDQRHDTLVCKEDMFKRLNDMMSAMCPLTPEGSVCPTILWGNTLYPIRRTEFPYFPAAFEVDTFFASGGVKAVPVVDILFVTYDNTDADVWGTTGVHRCQVLQTQDESAYVVISSYNLLFDLVHNTGSFAQTCKKVTTLDDALQWLHDHPLKELDVAQVFSLTPGMQVVKEGYYTAEIIQVFSVHQRFEGESMDWI